jgi:lipopolysaccharide export system permease protein
MRLLDRYLLRELLVPLGYCLSGLLIVFSAFDLLFELNRLQEHKLTAGDILEYYLTQIPTFLVLLLPIVLLLALLYALTNHARHHEITAIRAAGISLWRLCLPYFAVGLLASLGLFVFNELWVPACADHTERILRRRLPRSDPAAEQGLVSGAGLANTREGRTWLAGDYNPRTGEMRNPEVIWSLPDGTERWLFAAGAVRSEGIWKFYKVQEFRIGNEPNALPTPTLQTNVLAMPQFGETPEQIRSEINISKGMSLRTKNRADIPLSQIVDYLRLHPHPAEPRRLYTKLHGRLAAPWTCLVVVLIAIPFGAASGRRNVFVGVASSILICFAFYVLQQLCLGLGSGGYVPPWVAGWFPNLSFGTAGLWMTARVR